MLGLKINIYKNPQNKMPYFQCTQIKTCNTEEETHFRNGPLTVGKESKTVINI